MSDSAATPGSPTSEASNSEAQDLESVQAERDALREELERIRRPRRQRFRRVIVGAMAFACCLLVVLSTTVVWVHRTLLETNSFVAAVGPVFENRAVDAVVATRVTDELFTQLNLESRLATALPPKASFVAGPVTNAVEGFVAGKLTDILASHQFQVAWISSLGYAHQEVVAILRGQHSTIVTTSNGYIVLNTLPVVNQALGQISTIISNLIGHTVTLPALTKNDIPKAEIEKLSKSLGVTLPTSFGQITLFKSSDLSTAKRGVTAFDSLALLLPLFTLLLIGLTLWLSVARRRTILQISIGSIILLVIQRRALVQFEGQIAKQTAYPSVAHSVIGQLLRGFFGLTGWILALFTVVLAVALISGPYAWAVALRAWLVRMWKKGMAIATGERKDEAVAWLRPHAEGMQIVGAVVAVLILLIVSISWLSVLLILGILAAYELGLQRLKPGRADELSQDVAQIGKVTDAPDELEDTSSKSGE